MTRWHTNDDSESVFVRFRTAVITGLDSAFGTDAHYDMELERRFSVVHGSPLGAGSDIKEVLRRTTTREQLAVALERLLSAAAQIPLDAYSVTPFVELVATAVSEAATHHPGIALRLVKVAGNYELHPAGATELDAESVEGTLRWLGKYPAIQSQARKALRSHIAGDYSESLNAARVALEMLARALLQNSKTLENQIGNDERAPLLAWMKDRGVKPQIVTLSNRLVASFCDLQNGWVKHPPAEGASFQAAEAEYALYVVFTLMRLLSRIAP
jgi:hypothetical protein